MELSTNSGMALWVLKASCVVIRSKFFSLIILMLLLHFTIFKLIDEILEYLNIQNIFPKVIKGELQEIVVTQAGTDDLQVITNILFIFVFLPVAITQLVIDTFKTETNQSSTSSRDISTWVSKGYYDFKAIILTAKFFFDSLKAFVIMILSILFGMSTIFLGAIIFIVINSLVKFSDEALIILLSIICVLMIPVIIYILVRLSLAIPTLVIERLNILTAFKRSWTLTKGFTLRLLVITFALMFIQLLAQSLVQLTVPGLVNITEAFFTLIGSTIIVLCYHYLRLAHSRRDS